MKALPSPCWRFARRRARAVGLLCLVAYVIAATGAVPIPRIGRWLAAISPAAEPYPCQGHGCGCHSAQDCLDHCCCFTPAERLAWARARDLPGFAAAVEQTTCGVPGTEAASAKAPSCCSSGHDDADATTTLADAEDPAAPRPAFDDPARRADAPQPADPGWGYHLSPLRCKSIDTWLLVAIPFSDLLSSRAWLPPPRLIACRRAPVASPALSCDLDVPVPPPRA